MNTTLEQDADRVLELIQNRLRDGSAGNHRIMVGIAGPPASGKSALAEAVVQKLNDGMNGSSPQAVLLPMDGYHLDNRILESRGLLARKGAPETFDSEGFSAAVQQLAQADQESYHPKFDRQMDLAIANAIAIPAEVPTIVVEGNYLLLNSAPWSSLKQVFGATVFVCPSQEALQDRLHRRWLDHGLDGEAAMKRAMSNDMPNARTVIEQSSKADLFLDQNYTEFGVRYAY